MRHLYSNKCHDEAEVWCGDLDYYRDLVEPTNNPEEADCPHCLVACAAYGARAEQRLLVIPMPTRKAAR